MDICFFTSQTQHSFLAQLPKCEHGQQVAFASTCTHFTLPCISVPQGLLLVWGASSPFAAGRLLFCNEKAIFQLTNRVVAPPSTNSSALSPQHAQMVCYGKALQPLAGGEHSLTLGRAGISLAWITLSDKGAHGMREDESGPLIEQLLKDNLPINYSQGFILPDDPDSLRALVCDLSLHQGFDIIISTGGTGLGPRDTTPEAIIPLLSHRLPGFEQAMMQTSLTKTPHAALSRALCGAIGQSIILCLPGSKKAVAENLETIMPALLHAVSKIQGDRQDCARV